MRGLAGSPASLISGDPRHVYRGTKARKTLTGPVIFRINSISRGRDFEIRYSKFSTLKGTKPNPNSAKNTPDRLSGASRVGL